MKITKENYELFFIDYFDGRLNLVESAKLMLFLSENNDLEEEFNTFQNYKAPRNEVTFKVKTNLKKNFQDITEISDLNFEEFCVAFLEGDLDEISIRKFDNYILENSNKKRDFQLYLKTKLSPEKAIVYPDHGILKKQKVFTLNTSRITYYVSSAAVLLLAVFLLNKKMHDPENSLVIEKKINQTSSDYKNSNNNLVLKQEEIKTFAASVKEIKIVKKIIEIPIIPEEKKKEDLLQKIKPIEITKLNLNVPISAKLNHVRGNNIIVASVSTKKEIPEEKEFVLVPEIIPAKDKLNLWALAEIGIKGVNYLTESDLRLQKITSDKGEKVEFNFNSERYGFSTYRKK